MNHFEVLRDNSVSDFLESTSSRLYANEAENSLMLGLCEGISKSPALEAPVLLRLLKDKKLFSVAVQLPPNNLILSRGNDEEIKLLANYLFADGFDFPGVAGPTRESETFSKIWSSLTGKKSQLGMGQKIYKLEKVNQIAYPDGDLKIASQNDLDVVRAWAIEFAKESLPKNEQRNEKHWKEFAEKAIMNQSAHLWCVDDEPVSLACASRPTKNGVTINFVYTPMNQRKNGFASAVTAALSQKMLDSGKKFCVLYTDTSNPTSNKIYQAIGYQEIAESKYYLFIS